MTWGEAVSDPLNSHSISHFSTHLNYPHCVVQVDMGADRVNEMTAINGSLSALATVVSALTEGKHRKHVPYRDSKLTHLLQVGPCGCAFQGMHL